MGPMDDLIGERLQRGLCCGIGQTLEFFTGAGGELFRLPASVKQSTAIDEEWPQGLAFVVAETAQELTQPRTQVLVGSAEQANQRECEFLLFHVGAE